MNRQEKINLKDLESKMACGWCFNPDEYEPIIALLKEAQENSQLSKFAMTMYKIALVISLISLIVTIIRMCGE